jgi:hypothetical protein
VHVKRSIVLILAVLPLLACSFGKKKRDLRYPEVYVNTWDGSNFRSVRWNAGQHRGPCPLVIRLPAGDMGAADLADPAGLRRAGWLEHTDRNRVVLYRSSPPALVQCTYEGGRLVEVEVSTREDDRVEVAIGSHWLALPAIPDQVTEALGPPPKSD